MVTSQLNALIAAAPEADQPYICSWLLVGAPKPPKIALPYAGIITIGYGRRAMRATSVLADPRKLPAAPNVLLSLATDTVVSFNLTSWPGVFDTSLDSHQWLAGSRAAGQMPAGG